MRDQQAINIDQRTMQDPVRKLVPIHDCDSVSLSLQKFLNVSRACSKDTLKDFCRDVEKKKSRIQSAFSKIPEISGAHTFTAVNRGRLLVNHTGGIIENSNLALHRFFGCPVIPGSALKGIARSAAAADEGKDPEQFARVFGGLEKGKSDTAGSVAFLQALPVDNKWKMTVDVLTSHHGSDTKNPTPVFFPAVESGAVFRFVIAPTSRTEDGDLDFAEKYLKTALTENGVGAKTAAGYGWFEIKEDHHA